MNKRTKIVMAVLVPIFILGLLLSMILGEIQSHEVKPVEIPKVELSDSLFMLQNNEYVSNDQLKNTLSFEVVPYMVDVPSATSINVGNGFIFHLDTGYFVYGTLVSKGSDVSGAIKEEFAKALITGSRAELSSGQVIYSNYGYFNGFEMTYFVYGLQASDGETSKKAYLVGYLVTLPEYEYDFCIATATLKYSTDTLASCKDCSDGIIQTIRFDEKKDEALKQQAAQEQAQAEIAAQEQAQEQAQIQQDEKTIEDLETVTEDQMPEDAVITEHTVNLKSNYENLRLEISWSNIYAGIDMILYNPDRTCYYIPVSCENGMAVFDVGEADAGEYCLVVTGSADYGKLSMRLKDNE